MSSEMEKLLLEEEKNYQEVYKGSIVKGRVMIEKDDSFYIDLNYKTDGILPKDQVIDSESIKVGDEIEVQVVKIDKNTGDILLSKKRVDEFKVWDEVKVGDVLQVKAVEFNAKGLICVYKTALRGFMPLSHIELKFIGEDVLKSYLGKTFEVEIIDDVYNEGREEFEISIDTITTNSNCLFSLIYFIGSFFKFTPFT